MSEYLLLAMSTTLNNVQMVGKLFGHPGWILIFVFGPVGGGPIAVTCAVSRFQ